MAAHGQPCWIDTTVTTSDEREGLVAFLCDLFDWTAEVNGPDTGYYTMLRSEGIDVCAIGQQEHASPGWVTYFCTDDIEASARRVVDNGGRVIMGPHTVMRAGTMAVCFDPVGAAFGLWQPDLFAGLPDSIAPGRPEWFHHGSPDPDVAAAFYAQVFDLVLMGDDGDPMLGRDGRAFFSLGRNVAGNAPDIKSVILVDDLDTMEDQITGAGGQIYASRVRVPGGFATTFADPVVGAPLILATNTD
ncbi:MAG: VOC family protein [Actinomycetota bacterium]